MALKASLTIYHMYEGYVRAYRMRNLDIRSSPTGAGWPSMLPYQLMLRSPRTLLLLAFGSV